MLVNLMQETEKKGELVEKQKEEIERLEQRLDRMINHPLFQ
jgi:hypothetical protein